MTIVEKRIEDEDLVRAHYILSNEPYTSAIKRTVTIWIRILKIYIHVNNKFVSELNRFLIASEKLFATMAIVIHGQFVLCFKDQKTGY
jgi:hypothetical protein